VPQLPVGTPGPPAVRTPRPAHIDCTCVLSGLPI